MTNPVFLSMAVIIGLLFLVVELIYFFKNRNLALKKASKYLLPCKNTISNQILENNICTVVFKEENIIIDSERLTVNIRFFSREGAHEFWNSVLKTFDDNTTPQIICDNLNLFNALRPGLGDADISKKKKYIKQKDLKSVEKPQNKTKNMPRLRYKDRRIDL